MVKYRLEPFCRGNVSKKGSRPILRWSERGKGSYREFEAATDTIMHILPLRDGGMLFCAADPIFDILDRNGKRNLSKGPAIADYRDNWKDFRISGDGTRVGFGYEQWGKRPAVFSMLERTLTSGSANGPDMRLPVTEGLSITGWKNKFDPKINGKAIKIDPYERSRCLAIAPGQNEFILGADWYIRCFDRKGLQKWKIPAPGTVWSINISGDGRLLVAAMGDGTIRWFRMTDGKPLVNLFPHNDGKRWVMWTPSGYYAASAGGEDLIGWHLNRGRDKTPDFFSASRFRSIYYRPDVTAKVITTLDEKEAVRIADQEAGRKKQKAELKKILPPVITIISPVDGSRISDPSVTVAYAVRTPSGEAVTGIKILVDGRPVAKKRGVAVIGKVEGTPGKIQVNVPEKDCEVALIAENRYTSSAPSVIRLKWHDEKPSTDAFVIKPKLYVLAIGVGAYKDPDLNLAFPAKDAGDFARVLNRQKGKLYRDVIAKVLTDKNATKEDVLDGLEWIERETTSVDVAMVFLAGHGVNDRNGNYYFLPGNVDLDRLKRTGVPYHTIRDTISNLPGKVLFFVDTCHAGNIMGRRRGNQVDIDRVANELASAENGVVVFASSTGRQYSLEDNAWKNGAFTLALVEGMTGKADYRGKGVITITMLELYISERVKELTRGQQTPTTAKPETVQDFPVAMK